MFCDADAAAAAVFVVSPGTKNHTRSLMFYSFFSVDFLSVFFCFSIINWFLLSWPMVMARAV